MKSILTLIIVNKVYLKNHEEIELIRDSSLIVSKTLGMLASEIKPGVICSMPPLTSSLKIFLNFLFKFVIIYQYL